MDVQSYEDWVVVFKSGTDYEADLVRDRLDDAGIAAVVLSQRDHAFNLTHGDLAQVRVLTPPEHVAAAAEILASAPFTEEELAAASLTAQVHGDAHDPDMEPRLDSGNEEISFDVPDPEEDEEKSA